MIIILSTPSEDRLLSHHGFHSWGNPRWREVPTASRQGTGLALRGNRKWHQARSNPKQMWGVNICQGFLVYQHGCFNTKSQSKHIGSVGGHLDGLEVSMCVWTCHVHILDTVLIWLCLRLVGKPSKLIVYDCLWWFVMVYDCWSLFSRLNL